MLRQSEKLALREAHADACSDLGNDDDDDYHCGSGHDDVLPEDSYFTYRPLSSLPTPPLSSRDSSASLTPDAPSSPSPSSSSSADQNQHQHQHHDGEPLDPNLRGPALHLVNLIPASASLATASVPLVQAMLGRAGLALETVALAVCILDSLDSRFARAWRLTCPITTTQPPPSDVAALAPEPPSPMSSSSSSSSPSKRHSLPPSSPTPLADCHRAYRQRRLHIDSVPPELIVLAALVIAAKFTEDPQLPAAACCSGWGRGRWSPGQLNATERCVMESLGYRIMPLCDPACIAGAVDDMRRAAAAPRGRHHQHHHQEQEMSAAPSRSRQPESPGLHVPGSTPAHARSRTVAAVGVIPGLFLDLGAGGGSAETPGPTSPIPE